MAFTTEFVMGAGGAEWDEFPFAEMDVGRSEYRTLTTEAPPSGIPALALVIHVNHSPGGRGAGTILIGSRSVYLVAGTNYIGDVITTATQIELRGGSSFSTPNSSFEGSIFTKAVPN